MDRRAREAARDHQRRDDQTTHISEAHLRRYTARNTFDYFIHKDLGAFLRRELDFYIKNEVMHLDDVEDESAPRVEQYLSKIKVIRRIAGKLIDFLAQIEGFQKKLWLKKKFVVETSTASRSVVSRSSFTQRSYPMTHSAKSGYVYLRSTRLPGDIVEIGYSTPLTVEFLKTTRSGGDTQNFPPEFTERLIAALGQLMNRRMAC